MKITRLRLLGFKSFVEPTELVIEPGLTGVVGPNGCGKSNLLEALRWVMGETSHKSMRAAAMDDVIFSGTNTRPGAQHGRGDDLPRQRRAQGAGRVQRRRRRSRSRAASSARRARPTASTAARCAPATCKILFEDAATGARSPALVRQGQIGEIVNAKPRTAPPHPRGCRRHRRPAQPPPRGRAAAQGRRGQSRAPQRRRWASSIRRSRA